MSINLYEEIIDEGHKIAAKDMNDNIELRRMGVWQQWMDEWQHRMATNGGWRRADEER
jgi:hypothetical protein